MEDSIFTRIIKGEIACQKVYEDDKVLAFMDIHPIQPGHILVIPKQQVSHFDDLPDEIFTHLFLIVKKASKQIKKVLEPSRVCLRIEGFDVPHAHVHIYPCDTAQDFYGDKSRQDKDPDFPALQSMAEKLKFS